MPTTNSESRIKRFRVVFSSMFDTHVENDLLDLRQRLQRYDVPVLGWFYQPASHELLVYFRQSDRNTIKSLLRMWLLIDRARGGDRCTPFYCQRGVYTPCMFFGKDAGGKFIATVRPGHWGDDNKWVDGQPLKHYPLGEKTAVAA